MKAFISILCFVPVLVCLIFLICRYLGLTHIIDPITDEQDYSADDLDFDAEVESLINSRKNNR